MQGGRCTYSLLSFVFLFSELSGMPRSRGWTAGTYPRRHTLLGFLVSCMPPWSGSSLNGCTAWDLRFFTCVLSLWIAYARMMAPSGMLACAEHHKIVTKDSTSSLIILWEADGSCHNMPSSLRSCLAHS